MPTSMEHYQAKKEGWSCLCIYGEFSFQRRGFDPQPLMWLTSAFNYTRTFKGYGCLTKFARLMTILDVHNWLMDSYQKTFKHSVTKDYTLIVFAKPRQKRVAKND